MVYLIRKNNKNIINVNNSFGGFCRDNFVVEQRRIMEEIKKPVTHRDGGEQSLGHVRDDDADEEDDALQPGVVEADRDNEEGDAEHDRDRGDYVNEVRDLLRYRRLARLQTRRESRDASDHRAVARVDHHSQRRPCRQHAYK